MSRTIEQTKVQTIPTNPIYEIICCPKCGGTLKNQERSFLCRNCERIFPITDNIPQLFWPTEWDDSKFDVTNEMKSFYEATPFPNYDEFDSIGSLVEKARRRVFARLLDNQIPFGARVLECGCGTGQLTNFLSVANRTVVGTDICMNSLRLGQRFRDRNALKRAQFLQMNLFTPCFQPGSFDLVISNGVLHHTSDPFLGFKTIGKLVKPNGYIIVGLYHMYGRLTTDLRRILFRITGDRLRFVDPRMTEQISEARKTAWFMDQYKNPHESKHTIGEVISWFNQTGFTFVKSLPSTVLFEPFKDAARLFVQSRPGNWFGRSLAELSLAFTASRDGGLFVVIGRKSE
jgi:2-polyprenyl-3-methyl-5-hydroxy-6-metoxy-1,4-benzoquinol methylase